MVRLGHINYLNCLPVHGALILKLVPFAGEIIEGPPSYLNKLLEKGDLDISPSSSFEITKGHKILRNFSISSKKEVKSIVLVTKKELNEIKKGLFFITAHSKTSLMLLKLILKEFIPTKADFLTFDPEGENLKELLSRGDGILYIGDYALKNLDYPGTYKYDLAEVWHNFTNLPFTFALWQVSKNTNKINEIKSFEKILRLSYEFFINNKRFIADSFSEKMGFDSKYILDYWEHLTFDLNETHMESLRLFFKLLKKNDLIEKEPEILFFD
ncbi:MAG: menaquinone biosynthesis protein [Proteobacteria bacterium]|nr:menaquinone biosynthesis protein [Pseudomonadota bacterium]